MNEFLLRHLYVYCCYISPSLLASLLFSSFPIPFSLDSLFDLYIPFKGFPSPLKSLHPSHDLLS